MNGAARGDPAAVWIVGCIMRMIGHDGVAIGEGSTGYASSRPRVILDNLIELCANDGVGLFGSVSAFYILRNVIRKIARGGVAAFDFTSGDGITTHADSHSHVVRGNIISECVDGINNINVNATGTNVFDRNVIFECDEHAMWIFHGLDVEMKIQCTNNIIVLPATMNSTIANFLGLTLPSVGGIVLGYLDGDYTIPIADNWLTAKVYNNTFVNLNSTYPSLIVSVSGTHVASSVIDVRNNIFKGGRHLWVHRNGGAPTVTWDRNCVAADATAAYRRDTTDYDTFAAWKAATGYDANSVLGDPLLRGSLAAGVISNAEIGAGSPAIGIGADLSSVFVEDIGGRKRPTPFDAGAFQRLARGF